MAASRSPQQRQIYTKFRRLSPSCIYCFSILS
nr:MAG TPA: KCNMB2, ball and chain domain [Caudoviricetes sp.]